MKRFLPILIGLLCAGMAVATENKTVATEEEMTISADRPGMATGADVLPFGHVQWETGFECGYDYTHVLTLPTTMLRFGIAPFAELRLEYDGYLEQDDNSTTVYADESDAHDSWTYAVAPLIVGTKIRVFDGSDDPKLRWIPKTSFLLNLAIPDTKEMAETMHVAPAAYLLFQNDICDWFNIGYNVGAEWNGIDARPDVFLALCLGFNITEKFGAFLESYNYFTKLSMSQTEALCNLDFGFNYTVHPRVQLDLFAGFNCQNPSAGSFAGLGVAWLIH